MKLKDLIISDLHPIWKKYSKKVTEFVKEYNSKCENKQDMIMEDYSEEDNLYIYLQDRNLYFEISFTSHHFEYILRSIFSKHNNRIGVLVRSKEGKERFIESLFIHERELNFIAEFYPFLKNLALELIEEDIPEL